MPNPTALTPSQRKWQDLIEVHQYNALPPIQSAAEKWAGTISTLTGVFSIAALVKGNDDIGTLTETTQWVVGGILAVALFCAFLAILCAALAAQGIPKTFTAQENPYNNPDTFRDYYLEETRKAASRLNKSRFLVIPATALLAIAIGITWFGPTTPLSSATTVLVTQRAGSVICGELVDGEGNLSLKNEQGETPSELSDVAALDIIDACP
jgi:hypothetical protein